MAVANFSLFTIHFSLRRIYEPDAFNHLIGDLGGQVLRRIVEHGRADAVFSASTMEDVHIHAALAPFPERLVFRQVGEGHRLVT